MMSSQGYKAKYDYVELVVEEKDGVWRLGLKDPKHGETVEHSGSFDSSEQAKDAAVELARRHIFEKHNDTLLAARTIAWTEY
jgi:hypothetical protein